MSQYTILLFYFTFVRIVSISNLIGFIANIDFVITYQCIFDWFDQLIFYFSPIKEGRCLFTIAFIILYLIERIAAVFIIQSILNLSKKHFLFVISLSPFYLEEVFLLQHGSQYKQYINSGIIGQGMIVSIASTPMHVMTIYQAALFPFRVCAFVPGFLAFNSIFLLLLQAQYFLLLNQESFSSNYEWRNFFLHLREAGISALQFFTYFALLYINGTHVEDFFSSYMKICVTLILISFSRIIKNINKSFFQQKLIHQILMVLGTILKQLLHVDFDQRQINQTTMYSHSLKKFGIYYFDEMIFFSFCLKLYLLITLIMRALAFDLEIEQTQLILVVLVASLISVGVQGSRLFKYKVTPSIIEIFSFKELASVYAKYRSARSKGQKHRKWENLKMIFAMISDFNESDSERELLTEILFSGFESTELDLTPKFSRKLINNSSSDEKSELLIQNRQDVETIIRTIKKNNIVKNIKLMRVRLNEGQELQTFTKALVEESIFIEIGSVFHLTSENTQKAIDTYNKLVILMNANFTNYTVFAKHLAPYQQFNPLQIFYDLLDSGNLITN